jgi:hypothetical protein
MTLLVKTSIVVFLGIFLTYLCRYFPAPFIWVFLLWFLIFLWMSFFVSKSFIKIASVIITIVILIISMSEIYLWRVEASKVKTAKNKSSKRATVSSSPSLRIAGIKTDTVPHKIYGYSLRKNSKRKVTAYFGDRILYDITYTVDKDGLRISPKAKKEDATAILFFGDSFTYGESVSDNETMPYVTGVITNGEYAIYNFGISGHGPQLMLAQIEHGDVDSVIKHRPLYAIYQVIPDNIIRLKGLRWWLIDGPQYVMNRKGEIVSSSAKKFLLKINVKLRRSYLYNYLYQRLYKAKITSDLQFLTTINKTDDQSWGEGEEEIDMKLIKTFAGVVDKSRKLLESKYPGIKFHTIYWDDEKDLGDVVIEELRKKGITTHKVTDILPGSFIYDAPYVVPYDGHPSPLAHKIIANYIVKEIINK